MDGELRISFGGYSISVSKASAPNPPTHPVVAEQPAPLSEGSASSFELVDLPAEVPSYTAASSKSPYPLPASGPSVDPDLGLAFPARAPARQRASRSLVASPLRVPEYPLQGPLRPRSEVKASFPQIPLEVRDACRRLREGT